MLKYPESIKYLLRKDGISKNLRIHFPNGEREDITNDNVVFESLKFTESLCSRNELKFGLAEASTLRFTTVGVENIKGCTIEAQIEVDCSSLSNTKEVLIDDLEFVYLENGEEAAVEDIEFYSYDGTLPEVYEDICISASMLNVYNADGGFDTVYYTPTTGWVLDTIRSTTLEEDFSGIEDSNAYIYDIPSGSLGRARNRGEYWEVTGVTNLKNPSSPNYDLYANGVAEEFDIFEADDVPFPFIIVPLGSFRVDSCERTNDLEKRNVVAMTDVGRFFSLPEYEISKIRTSRLNEIEYKPNLYGILSYYGIFSEYISDGGEVILDENNASHQMTDTRYEETPLNIDDPLYIGTAVDGSALSIGNGTKIPANTLSYYYKVATKAGEGIDDTFDINTVFKIDSISEKELIKNTFDINDGGFLRVIGEEAIAEINNATLSAALNAGVDADSFLIDNTEENRIRLARVIVTIAYATYRYLRKLNNYKTVTTPKVKGADTNRQGEDVYQFGGDLPTLFNNAGFDKYRMYPFFPSTAYNNSVVYNEVNIPVLFLIRLSGMYGFNIQSYQGDYDDLDFVTEEDGQEAVYDDLVFTAVTDYSGRAFDIEDVVFHCSSTLSGYNLEYTPTMYKEFPEVKITKSAITKEKEQDFSKSTIEYDENGYYKVNNFTPRDWVTDYMEAHGLFCIYDRAAMCYKERSLQSTYHTLYPMETLYPSDDLYPEETEIQLYRSHYSSIWYAENLVGPIGGIKYDYVDEEAESTVVEGEDLTIDTTKDGRVTAYYPEDDVRYNYDLTGNKLLEDADKETAEAIVSVMYREIEDVYYMPSTVQAVGVPYIEVGDYIALTTKDDHIETIVLRRTLSGIHLLKDQLESK